MVHYNNNNNIITTPPPPPSLQHHQAPSRNNPTKRSTRHCCLAAAHRTAGPFGGDDPRTFRMSRYLLAVASSGKGLRAGAASLAISIWNVRHIVATTADVVTDILFLVELLPNKLAFILMVPMLLADVVGGAVILRAFAAPQPDGDDGDDDGDSAKGTASDETPQHAMLPNWSAALSRLLLDSSRKAGRVGHALVSLLILPLLSLTIHLLSATLFLPWRRAGGSFGTLDIGKCCSLRSLLVTFIEAPTSIAFITWAYLIPYKYVVGNYVSAATFFASLAASMVHLWLGVWDYSGRVLEHRGRFGRATRSFFDVRFDLMTSDVVLFSGKAGAGGKGAVAVNAVPGSMYTVATPVESLPVPGPPAETKAGPSPQRDHVVDLCAGEVEEQPGKA
jgi:hypothetical protein